jgi:hypothetical protein
MAMVVATNWIFQNNKQFPVQENFSECGLSESISNPQSSSKKL